MDTLASVIEQQAQRNRILTWVLGAVALVNVFLLAILTGILSADRSLFALCIVVITLWVIIAYFYYDRIVIRATHARDPQPGERARIAPIMQRLLPRLEMSEPKLQVIDDTAANAFAVGVGDNAIVVVSTGMLTLLNDDELEGVLAHELAHIANGDTRTALIAAAMIGWGVFVSGVVTVVAIFVGIAGVSLLAASTDNDGDTGEKLAGFFAKLGIGLGLILAALVGWVLVQGWFLISRITHLAISRQREWLADATAARVTGKPLALARALEKLAGVDVTLEHGERLARALCVAAPPRTGNWWQDLLQTHPDVAARIARLRSYANQR